MTLAAAKMGILSDRRGIECPSCLGRGSIGEGEDARNCLECHGEGRLSAEAVDEALEAIRERPDFETLDSSIVLMYGIRERPPSPLEWMALPAAWVGAWRFLSPYLFGEFDERRKALEGGGDDGSSS